MNDTHTRLAILLALSAMALVACGGSSTESLVGPGGSGGDDATFTALGKGPGNGSAETPAGDGVCDGTGDGACDGTGQGPGYGPGNGQGQGNGPGNGNGNGPGYGPGDGTCDGTGSGDGTCTCTQTGPDPDDLQALLVLALQEEYKAEYTYRRVLADLGDVMPFAAIAESEQQHVQALLGLFANRGWSAPGSDWTLGNVDAFDTLPAACAGGVAVEIEDGALYDQFLAREDLPCDAVNVFTNLRFASIEHHLPAFERCQ